MPCLLIELDGKPVATIDLNGMVVVEASVHGALDQNPRAMLHASGGNYAEGACGHLIWVTEHPLLPGEVVSVKLCETCTNPDRGKTIDELYPDEEPLTKTDFTISDEMAAALRARPKLHDAFSVRVKTSQGQQAVAESDDRNTSFTFSVLWDSTRSSQARVHLSTHCLDDVLARKIGTKHLASVLSFGESASFSLDL